MGTVYEASNLTIGRAVAVKVLHPQQMRRQEAIKRFHHEARAAGAIGHPNICEVYDLGTLDDGRPYLVMEKLVGKTLADRIKEDGGLPLAEVADVLTQVLSGLVAAHAKGILHRDIKPENIFLAARVGCPPVAKLLDFGVSKMIAPQGAGAETDDEMMNLTRTGMVMGTPYYMSPEQARGERDLDGRVDLYACGVLAYEAVTGRRPFLANNYHALLVMILEGRLRAPRELRPDLPPAFQRIIEKAMARQRSDRYASAADFQRDLQRLETAQSPPAPEPPLAASASRPIKPPRMGLPVVELSSDDLGSASSANVPAAKPALTGFEDMPTEIQGLRDFSMAEYDDDVATTLMREDEVRAASRKPPPAAPKTMKPFDADETTRMDPRPDHLRVPPPRKKAPR